MSLINQMLRDLESRRKKENRQLPAGENPTASTGRGFSWRPVSVVAGGLLLAGVIWFGIDLVPKVPTGVSASGGVESKEPPVARLAQPDAVIAVADRQRNQPLVVVPVVTPPAIAALPNPLVVEPRAENRTLTTTSSVDMVTDLLNLGVLEAATVTRLMLEFEQRPKYEWSFVDPGKTQLCVELPHVAMRTDMVLPAIGGPVVKKIELQQTKNGLQLAVVVAQQVEMKTLELPADPFHGQRLLLEFTLPASVAHANQKVQTSATRLAADSLGSGTQPSNRVSKTVLNLSREEQAEQAYQSALEKLGYEDFAAAEVTLSHALILNPRLLKARLQLIELLQNLRRADEAEKLLQLGLQLHPMSPELRKGYARCLLDAGNLSDALSILQPQPQPEIVDDLEYHALLAALFQETGEHQSAITAYRHLLDIRPQEGLWWMGLAISLDQSGAAVKAKDAYQQAIALPGLRPDLQDYIHNRLQLL